MMHAKHIALEKIRNTLSLLRKSNLYVEAANQESSIVQQLKSLQHRLRSNETEDVDPIEVISPFISVLRAQTLAGPYKSAALDAIQAFISCNILSEQPSKTGDALAEVVDAVTRCKFVQTDVNADDLVQLRLVQVLQSITKSTVRTYLTDETAWAIVESCYTFILQAGQFKPTLYQVAEQALLDSVHFIFSCVPESADLSLTSTSKSTSSPPCITTRASFGLPCAMKVLGYFVHIVQKHSADTSHSTRMAVLNGNGKSGRPNLNRTPTPLMDAELDPETLELLLALRTIHAMLTGEGNLNAPRDLILGCRPLATLVRDDLGRCLILLTTKREFPPAVLQTVLGVVATLIASLGPGLRILIECAFLHVYLKGLHQILGLLKLQEEELANTDLNSSESSRSAASATFSSQLHHTGLSSGFQEEELEMILESMCDLISNPGFLTSLFASFDCEPTKPDIVRPLISYLGQCSRIVMSMEGPELGSLAEVGQSCVRALQQITSTLTRRCEEERAEKGGSLGGMRTLIPAAVIERVSHNLHDHRLSKELLAEAATRFVKKPKLGLQYLQQQGALPTPPTPSSVAKFLRVAPGLPKEDVGSFLGELGKDDASYEADSRAFHEAVLSCYVQSFEFGGLSLVNCMRLFLSAFRLPGEAQQIDRILVKFSEITHSFCTEGVSGVLENPEVTYLLSFSIIMLNTDRHNPNIRSDRKMTIDQFVRNNTNYGADLNQTKNLSREYLESIYGSISEFPIRTEKNDISGAFTQEVWMDLQLQADIYPEKGAMITTSYSPRLLRAVANCLPDSKHPRPMILSPSQSLASFSTPPGILATESPPAPPGELAEAMMSAPTAEGTAAGHTESTLPKIPPTSPAAQVTLTLLTTAEVNNPLEFSADLYGYHEIFDADLVQLLWKHLLTVGMSPFIIDRLGIRSSTSTVPSDSSPHPSHQRIPRAAPPQSLRIGIDLLLSLLKLANSSQQHTLAGDYTSLQPIVDLIPLLLADCAGLLEGKVVAAVCSTLNLDINLALNIPPAPVTSPQTPYTTPKKATPVAVDLSPGSHCLQYVSRSIAARAALGTLLQLCHSPPTHLRLGWSCVWFTLAALRDCALLPEEMVSDTDGDVLPPQVRSEFEERLLTMAFGERKKKEKSQRRSVSLLSLQGLGEAFFGSSADYDDEDDGENGGDVYILNRWDDGYRPDSSHAEYTFVENSWCTPSTLASIKEMVVQCGLSSIIADSRFLTESALLEYMTTLIEAAEACDKNALLVTEDDADKSVLESSFSNMNEKDNDVTTDTTIHHMMTKLEINLIELFTSIPPASISSSAWLEMVVVETALRNRDRFPILWPCLSSHYRRMLLPLKEMLSEGSYCKWLKSYYASKKTIATALTMTDVHVNPHPSHSHDPKPLNYAAERRVVGLYKIATRMVGRRQACGPILELLSTLFSKPMSLAPPSTGTPPTLHPPAEPVMTPRKGYSMITSPTKSDVEDLHGSSRANWWPLIEVAAQISSGIWRLLTSNVSILPMLRLEQWQSIFDVVAVGAEAGGYASVKSFETMAWLIHEPRLRAEVPVFCVTGIRPLLRNLRAPVSVSVGGVHLLTHLHNRLEVLVGEDSDAPLIEVDGNADMTDDTPLLWESCWLPILQAMAETATDIRIPVRVAAVNALSHAILDKHSHSVPAAVLSTILKDVLAPVTIVLGRILEDNAKKSTNISIEDNLVSSDQMEQEIKLLEMLASSEQSSKRPKQQTQDEASEVHTDATAHSDEASGGATIASPVTQEFKTEGDASVLEASGSTNKPNENSSPSVASSSPASLLQLSLALSNEASHNATTILKGGLAAEALATLCKATLQQLKKLSAHSSFVRLWTALLHALGFYLGSPSSDFYKSYHQQYHQHLYYQQQRDSPRPRSDPRQLPVTSPTANNSKSIDLSLTRKSLELQYACESAREQLKNLLLVAAAQGMFEERPELWTETCKSIENMTQCQGMMVELFPERFETKEPSAPSPETVVLSASS